MVKPTAAAVLQASLFARPYRALVIGSSGAIGRAFVQALQADAMCLHVAQLSRTQCPGFDVRDEVAIAHHAAQCKAAGPYQLIIDATGALTLDGVGPEKSLSALKQEVLLRNFQINTVGPALLMRYFSPLLASGPCVYAKLSARVGSISDNAKGGWYGYRAAKAALNMVLQTMAIELQRKNPSTCVVALQPGTVRSELSKPFAASVSHLLEPEESVAGMLVALQSLTPQSGAHFVDYKGEPIAW